jgi:hypothetical protein
VTPVLRRSQHRPRIKGKPTSANGASSFHLEWALEAAPLVEVSAVLEVLVPPAVDSLYFWALQVGFVHGDADRGAAHVGLQWNNRHPGNTAVNWGGYGPGGEVLSGSESALPSAPGNPNTRDYVWKPERPYRLRVSAAPWPSGRWRGEVTDLVAATSTVIRDLDAGSDRLRGPMVWSEVFARCDDPSVAVRWSGFEALTADGQTLAPRALIVNYQTSAAGGCDNTTVHLDDGGVVQTTNAERLTTGRTALAWEGRN